MHIKEKYIYYGTAVLALLILITAILNILLGRFNGIQQDIESRLPEAYIEQEQDEQTIRVIIKTQGFQNITHAQVKLTAENGLRAISGEAIKEYDGGEVLCIAPDDALFQGGSIRIEPAVSTDKIEIQNLQRGYGTPSYRGSFELFSTAEGIVLVNELPLEEYLYGVVPSEMPASYELEALKAQAVCARSYAYAQTQGMAYPEYEAHVDDSVSFQVYGNSKEQASANEAVDATRGKCMWYNDNIAKAYYYSTSCGKSAAVEAWGTNVNENNQYLQSIDICDEGGNDYERNLAWYRWKAVIPRTTLNHLIELNTAAEIGELQELKVTKTGAGGVVLQITAKGSKGSVTVDTENKIRRALGGSGYMIEKQDGTTVKSQGLLPSAFFTIEKQGDNYVLNGGGYGHGIGMSQNGANEMAKAGKTYEEILKFFYKDIVIR